MEDSAKSCMEIMQQYGGWATTVFVAYALVRFYMDYKKTVNAKDTLIEKMNKEHHAEMIAVVSECTGVLTTVNESMDRCEKRQEKING